MNIVEVTNFSCGKCGRIYSVKKIAEDCCAPNYCKICDKEIEDYQIKCYDCAEKERFSKATKINYKDYDGQWIYCHVTEEYYESYELMAEDLESKGLAIPSYAYACIGDEFQFYVDDAIDSALEEHYEDAKDHLTDYDELLDFVKEWNKKQNIISYSQDYKTVVLFKEEQND